MRTALVTGAGGGIGKSVCEVFIEEGYRVIGVDCREISGLSCDVINFDICKLGNSGPDSERYYQHVENLAGGRLDAIVNNAAIQIVKPVNEITPDDWAITLDTNLLAPFWHVQKFMPLLTEAKGSVVNIASIHAELTKREFTLYSTSKGAMVSLTRALALELAPDVRVNAVLPAATDTPMLREGFSENLKDLEKLGNYHPMKRIARSHDVANAALFLAGPQSSFITGSAINVDGGIGGCLHDPA